MADETQVIDAPAEDIAVAEVEVKETPAKETPETKNESEELKGKETTEPKGDDKPAVNAELTTRAKSALDKIDEMFDALKRSTRVSKEAPDEIAEVKALISDLAKGGASTEEITTLKTQHAALQDEMKVVEASDQLLYSGDPKLVDNIVADLKSEGHIDALGKLTPKWLETLKAEDEGAYWQAMTPRFTSFLAESGLVGTVNKMIASVNAGDAKTLTGTLNALSSYLSKLLTKTEEPERTAKTEPATQIKTEQTAVSKEAILDMNRELGQRLRPYFTGALKDLPRDEKIDLANKSISHLRALYSKDAKFQKRMNDLWKAPKANRDEILKTHKEKLLSLADQVVKETITSRYPKIKLEKTTKADAGPFAGKPMVSVIIGGKKVSATKIDAKPAATAIDMERTSTLDLINHRAYLKSGRAVAWSQYQPANK